MTAEIVADQGPSADHQSYLGLQRHSKGGYCPPAYPSSVIACYEEIRGLLNAGHRKGAVAGRCVVRGKEVFTEELPAYCAVAMAGLGYLPDTILTRSVIVNTRDGHTMETVEPYRRRLEVRGEILRRRLEVWASQISEQISNKWPVMPEGITDRNADVWEALLSVADAAGGKCRNRAVSRLSRLSRFSGEERGALVSVSLPIYAPSSVSGS